MRKTAVYLSTSCLLLVAGAGFAIERGLAHSTTRAARSAAVTELAEALKLAAKHPGAFGAAGLAPGESALKALAQDMATQRGLSIGFLSESEREAERGRQERQVIVRLVHPAHGSLVRFLGDLEAQGGGAKIKEIHVRPSTTRADHYEEAEVVVARVTTMLKP
ncbi:MAG TPA: hypothetical protein VF950_22635 [Planctomycetota bacterium]